MSEAAPSLRQLYLYLTAGCNLACRHCYLAPKLDPDGTGHPTLPVELLEQALDEAAPLGLEGVKLTGGEPLLHPRIGAILALLAERSLNLAIETNGVLLTPALVEAIAAFPSPFVSVSLDGADARTHDRIRGIDGSFDKTTRGVRLLAEAGVAPQVIMTVMENNLAQVEPVVRLAEELGASSVKFNIVQPMARGEGMRRSDAGLGVAELIALCRWIDTDLAEGTNLGLHPHIPPAFLSLRHVAEDTVGRCGIFGILGLLPDGQYALCGVGETVEDLAFGRVGTVALSEIWNSNPVLAGLRRDLPSRLRGICGTCVTRTQCLGTCVAQNYYRDRDLLAPYWFCEEAHHLGLFPPSRVSSSALSTH